MRDYIVERPVVYLSTIFIVGHILLLSDLSVYLPVLLLIAVVVLRRYRAIVTMCVVLVLTYGYGQLVLRRSGDMESLADGYIGLGEVRGQISSDPFVSLSDESLELRLEGGSGEVGLITKTLLYSGDYEPGMSCLIVGRVERIENSPSSAFDYAGYMADRGVYLTVRFPQSVTCDGYSDDVLARIKGGLYRWKMFFVDIIDRSLPEPQSSLLAGILLGEKRAFTDEFGDLLRISGTTHIIAASGYNIGVIVRAIELVFARLLNLKLRILLSFALILAFTMMSGLSPALVRATIMWSLVLFARFAGREADINILLLLSVVIFILFDPYIFRDVGFQLSIFSMFGLVYLLPVIELRSDEGWFGKLMLESEVLTTFAATVMTIPVIAYAFGEVSVIGVVSNVALLIVLSWSMLIGFGAVVFSFLSSLIGDYLFTVAYLQLKYFEIVVERFGSMEWLVFEWEMRLFDVFLYYLVVGVFIMWRSGRDRGEANNLIPRSYYI